MTTSSRGWKFKPKKDVDPHGGMGRPAVFNVITMWHDFAGLSFEELRWSDIRGAVPPPVDVQAPSGTLGGDLFKFCSNPELADVKLQIESVIIPAHKLVLVSRSSYFRALFLGPWKERDNAEPVPLQGVELHIFRIILKFMYTDQVVLNDAQEAWEICVGARFYDLVVLQHLAESHIISLISTTTAVEFYDLSLAYDMPQIARACVIFIRMHFNDIWTLESLSILQEKAFIEILDDDKLNVVDESDVFYAIRHWALLKHQAANSGMTSPDLSDAETADTRDASGAGPADADQSDAMLTNTPGAALPVLDGSASDAKLPSAPSPPQPLWQLGSNAFRTHMRVSDEVRDIAANVMGYLRIRALSRSFILHELEPSNMLSAQMLLDVMRCALCGIRYAELPDPCWRGPRNIFGTFAVKLEKPDRSSSVSSSASKKGSSLLSDAPVGAVKRDAFTFGAGSGLSPVQFQFAQEIVDTSTSPSAVVTSAASKQFENFDCEDVLLFPLQKHQRPLQSGHPVFDNLSLVRS
eukprot:TRINITY_DN9231_c0_g1_i1.p1 TRINITY_DN9231_c0_g1~~TRINITY_DN9231_c0_g1_i1.p1  ORF type:complete len:523 (-),score=101.04 TRINITY_DN9231_c0_g1_i1:1505-3073(-)